jgi:hypothetical protein
MKKKAIIVLIQVFLMVCPMMSFSQTPTWTYTYLKAKPTQKERLKNYLEKNWFAMDSIAVANKLFSSYELLENVTADNTQTWDFIVAVEYFNEKTYEGISTEFEAIRKKHTVVLIDGFTLKDLGNVVKSETVIRKIYVRIGSSKFK